MSSEKKMKMEETADQRNISKSDKKRKSLIVIVTENAVEDGM